MKLAIATLAMAKNPIVLCVFNADLVVQGLCLLLSTLL